MLIRHLFGPGDLPSDVPERIARTSEGNPLFVEEILGMLIDDGIVTYEGGRWIATGDVSNVTVPPSINALLAARVDRLTPEERTVLEAAAVVGQSFFLGAVRDLVPADTRERVPSDLLALVRKELVRPERSTLAGEDAFRFRHLLIRDSAYDAIPKARRAELHERLADWLERVAGDSVFEQEEIVGHHLEQAHAYRTQLGPSDKRSDAIGRRAAVRLASAGRRAMDRSDFAGAVNLLRRSLGVGLADDSGRAMTLYRLGTALGELDDYPGVFAAFDEAIELATASGDRSLEWLARISRSDMQVNADPFTMTTEELRAEIAEAIDAFDELDDAEGLATAWTRQANLDYWPCRYDQATRAAGRAVQHARASDDDHLLAEALLVLLVAQCAGSATPDEGLVSLEALQGDITRSRQLEGTALAVRGVWLGMRGAFDQARELAAMGIGIAEALGMSTRLAIHVGFLGDVETEAGDLIAAERAYRRAYELADAIGSEAFKTTPAGALARTLCGLGRFEEAGDFATIAQDASTADDLGPQVAGRSVRSLVLAAGGKFDEAERLGREAIRMFADAEDPNTQARIGMDRARVLLMAGKTGEAEEAARSALSFFERKGNRASSVQTRTFLEELGASAS